MASDMKIGLLLGLLFIFVIAFLINGLPSFKDLGNDGNELMLNMMSMGNETPGLGGPEKKAHERLFPGFTSTAEAALPRSQNWSLNAADQSTEPPRTVMDLSGANSPYESVTQPLTLQVQQTQDVAREVLNQFKAISPTQRLKYYEVQEGDVLATIAKKVYGLEQGNRHKVVQQLFEANRKELKTPDRIYVGQKLIIPPLTDATGVISAATFIPVRSSAVSTPAKVPAKNTSLQYKVKDGDSLWKIANKQLGDGCRYNEIADLNRDLLGDEDEIAVGMCLQLPN